METSTAVIIVGSLILLSHFLSNFYRKIRIPDVFFLIMIGLLLGPIFKITSPEDFGKMGDILSTIALVVILFESGIDLDFETMKSSMKDTMNLLSANFLLTLLVIASFAFVATSLTLLPALILGTILTANSPAVIIPMVQQIPLSDQSKMTLLLESVLSEVLCIVVTIALIESFKYGEFKAGIVAGQLLSSFILASLIGGVCAVVWSSLLNKIRELKNSLFITEAFLFIVYGVTETLGYSGAIASFAFGFFLGHIGFLNLSSFERFKNLTPVHLSETEKSFFSEIVFLLKTFFFVYLGISIPIRDFTVVLWGLGITFFIFIGRIAAVRFSIPHTFSKIDASLISAVVPKGLVAVILASILVKHHIPGAEFIRDVVYVTVLFSIVTCASIVFLIEKNIGLKFYLKLFRNYSET